MMQGKAIKIRALRRDELPLIWSIDRTEIIDGVYYHEAGRLVLKPEHYEMTGWPPGEPEQYAPLLEDCFNRGGTFRGAFAGDRLVGLMVLESRFIGRPRDQLQLKFMHVSHAHRRQGLGRRLFEEAVDRARELGARRLYISATPSQNTIDCYVRWGCRLATEVDSELFKLEPDDIHLEYVIQP